MGNVGMAFPGGADTLQQAQIAVYDAWQIVFYLLVPAITITFIGMAGAFNCLKAFMWGEKVEKSRKPSSKASKILVEIPYRYACRFASRACARQRVRILPEIEGDGCAQRRTLGDDNRRVSCRVLLLYVNMQLLPMIAEVDLPLLKQVKTQSFSA